METPNGRIGFIQIGDSQIELLEFDVGERTHGIVDHLDLYRAGYRRYVC